MLIKCNCYAEFYLEMRAAQIYLGSFYAKFDRYFFLLFLMSTDWNTDRTGSQEPLNSLNL